MRKSIYIYIYVYVYIYISTHFYTYGSFPKIGGPEYRRQSTMTFVIETPRKVLSILGTPIPTYNPNFHFIFHFSFPFDSPFLGIITQTLLYFDKLALDLGKGRSPQEAMQAFRTRVVRDRLIWGLYRGNCGSYRLIWGN